MIRFATIILLLFFGCSNIFAQQPIIGTLTAVDKPPPEALEVTIGFYPISVYQLEMGSNTFFADLYLWLRWKGDIDPVASLEFTNMVEKWNKHQEGLQETPKILPDGSKYQILKVEGRFVQPFNFSNYPLDKQKLTIQVEDSSNTAEAMTFVIDKKNSGLGNNFQIPGWSLSGWSAQVYQHDYGTNFGEDSASSVYSTAQFSFHIERSVSYFFWKRLMPLFIVLIAALSSLILSPRSIDARTALTGGALLTAIFLQMSYTDNLPELAYLILIDKIYLLAYVMIVFTLVRSILTFQISEKSDASVMQKIMKTDMNLMVGQLILFIIATAILIWLH